ncbi:MAG: hypothetical protein ACREYC_13350 [Gammaproteobacteria bacterium]
MTAKQDRATMTPAEREALEVADLRAQIGPLFDLYMACIELIEEEGPDKVHSNLHDALCLAVVVRKKLGLAQRNETKALAALLASGG